jgi:putative ABC transport system permease protein
MVLGFLTIVLHRLRSRLLLSSLLILTTALAVAITAGIPVFAGAVSQTLMQEEMDARSETKGWPVFSVRISAMPTERQPLGAPRADVQDVAEIHRWLRQELDASVGLPVRAGHIEVQSPSYRLAPREEDTTYTSEHLASVRVVTIASAADSRDAGLGDAAFWAESDAPARILPAPIATVSGAPFGEIVKPDVLNVWVGQALADSLALQAGETYELGQLYASIGDGLPVYVAGIWIAEDSLDDAWYRDPRTHFASSLLTTPASYAQWIAPTVDQGSAFAFWYYVMDERRLNLDRADTYIGGLTSLDRQVKNRLPGGQMDLDPREDLLRGRARKQDLQVVLFGFSVPVIIILIYFLGSLSATQTRFQATEIAMMASRGSSRWQLVGLWALESLVILAAAIPLGLLGALLLARSMGFADGFLSFTSREPLQVSLASIGLDLLLALVGASLLVRLVATWRAGRTTVVAHERAQARRRLIWGGVRLTLTAALCIVTLYAYRQLTVRDMGLATATGASIVSAFQAADDPLVLLAPTLFLFAVPLLVSELFVLLMLPLGLIARYIPWVAGYLAGLNLARSGGLYRGPVFRLVVCLSLGVFYASAARSADVWLVDRLRYRVGSDITFTLGKEEAGVSLGVFARSGDNGEASQTIDMPMLPSELYEELPGVDAATRVGDFEVALAASGDLPYLRMLAVDRLHFASAAYFRSDYAAYSLGEMLNRLAMVPNGILIPHDLAARLGLGIGDTLRANVLLFEGAREPFAYEIVGLFEHFPTMSPTTSASSASDGESEDALAGAVLVSSLSFLEMRTSSLLPHSVWLRIEPRADPESVLASVRGLDVTPRDIMILPGLVAEEANRLERTGMFGLLTFCFLAAAALSVADMVVSGVAMLQERAVRHAVLRALGFRQTTLLDTVLLEQLASLAYGLAAGVVSGIACARLYVPHFPLTTASGPPVPPFIPLIDWGRTHQIAIAMGFALLVSQGVVTLRLMRTHLFAALRLGNRP